MSSRFVNPFTDLGFKIIFGQSRQQGSADNPA